MRFVKLAGIIALTFVLFCVGGLAFGRPNKPFVQIDPCYKGVMPSLAFSANPNFLWDMTTPQFGPKYGRFNLYLIGWPGGGLVISTNEAGICSYTTAEEVELAMLNVYWRTPASYDEEPEIGQDKIDPETKN